MPNIRLAKIMKTLQTIQKTLNVFRILSKVAYILCIVGAAASGVSTVRNDRVFRWHGLFAFRRTC